MFEPYVPRKFCREFVEASGNSVQISTLMAVVAGLKPAMDVWVPAKGLRSFLAACRTYGLKVSPDVMFHPVSRHSLSHDIVGRENLTTTVVYGYPYDLRRRRCEAHLFLARREDDLERAVHFGWYPVIIDGRVMEKPLVDFYRFGHALGYPSCCVSFFQKYNNWKRYNFLWEIFKNTSRASADYLCNPLPRDEVYAYIAHMPCSYGCPETIEFARRLREIILAEEPVFAHAIDRHLQLPFLAFYERRIYAFEGELRNNELHYRKAYFVGHGQDYNLHEMALRKGDHLVLEDKDVVVLKKGRTVARICNNQASLADERPFIVQLTENKTELIHA